MLFIKLISHESTLREEEEARIDQRYRARCYVHAPLLNKKCVGIQDEEKTEEK